MKNETRIEAIRCLSVDANLGETIATKIVNYCSGFSVVHCIPFSWHGKNVVVATETNDGRFWETVFNKRGTFLYNRGFIQYSFEKRMEMERRTNQNLINENL